jgi:hypothetical protein
MQNRPSISVQLSGQLQTKGLRSTRRNSTYIFQVVASLPTKACSDVRNDRDRDFFFGGGGGGSCDNQNDSEIVIIQIMDVVKPSTLETLRF